MKDTKAYNLLKTRESKFIKQVDEAIDYAENMLPLINNIFNTYTIHGIKHAKNVAEYMYELVENAELLSDLEIVMIIYAALFHDIGMIAEDEEIKEIKMDNLLLGNKKYSKVLEKYGDEKIALQECVRPVHGLRSKQFIDNILGEQKKMFLIPEATNVSFQKEIALICQAHNENFEWLVSNLNTDGMKGHYKFNAQYIAVLLRIGDYLDIDEQRAPLYLYKYLKPKDYSDLEWRQHFVIDNYEKIFKNEKTGLKEIIFQGQSEDPTVHRKLLKYFDGINKELVNAIGLCEKYEKNTYLLNFKSHIINKIQSIGFSFSDFKLDLDYNAVTNLLMGEHIYGDRKYGLREIIQNSIDACKTMQETAENHPDFQLQKYEPFISITIDKDRNIVTILDNGSGMTTEILKKYFLNVGVSYYKSDDYVLQGKKYSPIGHYGIGFLACFMLSNKVGVKTRHIDENKITKIDFEKNSEYICLTYEEKFKIQGTEITLDYDQFMEVFNNDHRIVVKFVEENFLDCDIPINIAFQEMGQSQAYICKLKKIKEILPDRICLNKYLEGIEAYVECNYKNINFANKLEYLNGNESFYYDIDENDMIKEMDSDFTIKDLIKDNVIKIVTFPVLNSYLDDEFEKVYEVLEDYNETLEKIGDYGRINIAIQDATLYVNEEIIEFSEEEIIGNYTFKSFCEKFEHSPLIPTCATVENYKVVSSESSEYVLPFVENVGFKGEFLFDRKDKVYIKNVLLSKLNITIPYLLDHIILKNAVININNSNIFPNVSRDNVSGEMKESLDYAIGKALHLWLLDNMEFTLEQRKLMQNFIDMCYSKDNCCLKIS